MALERFGRVIDARAAQSRTRSPKRSRAVVSPAAPSSFRTTRAISSDAIPTTTKRSIASTQRRDAPTTGR